MKLNKEEQAQGAPEDVMTFVDAHHGQSALLQPVFLNTAVVAAPLRLNKLLHCCQYMDGTCEEGGKGLPVKRFALNVSDTCPKS